MFKNPTCPICKNGELLPVPNDNKSDVATVFLANANPQNQTVDFNHGMAVNAFGCSNCGYIALVAPSQVNK